MIYFIGPPSILPQCEVATVEDAKKYCESKTVLGVDTETEGLDFTCKKMIMFQIGDEENQYIIDTRHISIEPLRDILESRDIVKIFHNAKFDYKFIKRWANIECEGVYDTFLTELVNNCGKKIGFGLKDLVKREFNIELNKEVRNKFITLDGAPYTQAQIVYGAKDVEYLCKLRDIQIPKTITNRLERVVDLENEAVLAFADIEYNGLGLDTEAWKKIEKRNLLQAEALLINLDNTLIEDTRLQRFVAKYIQADMFTDVQDLRKVDVKWTSPKQVLNVFKTLISSLENVNGKEMYKYRYKYPIIDIYVQYKEAMKLCTSYGDAFFKNLKADNKIHTNFHQILDTGRVSSSKPNMQQIPADNIYRNCFIAPESWSFVSADYSSQELNVIAFGSKDPVWLKALEEGQDLHSTCAELVYGEQWYDAAEEDCAYYAENARQKCNCPSHKKLRTNVKTINFGLAYGMGPNKLADTINITTDDAKLLIEKYFTAFPAIKGFLDKLGDFGKKKGFITTFPPYRRRRWFTNWYPRIWEHRSMSMELGSIERASKNTPIQGASADMTKRALVLMRDYIKENEAPVQIVMTVHDQIDTICRNIYLDEWTVKMKELMEEAADEIVTNKLLKAEVTVSDCWEK
jgi:DNA polymerase I-like protein with 3'-5' exonuclease and polymerase domains